MDLSEVIALDQSKHDTHKKERAKQLGFEPQHEYQSNQHLPYDQSVIDEESKEALELIKTNLSKAVLAKEFIPSVIHWMRQLSLRYVEAYGLKFSKEDHILFLQLYLKLIATKDLEAQIVGKLIRKQKLLSPSDLTIEWRPLYVLVERIIHSKAEAQGLEYTPHNIHKELADFIALCRNYFPKNATREMLEEWRPLLCPFDVTMLTGLEYTKQFLPTTTCDESGNEHTWKLWFEEFYSMWDSIHNGPQYEENLIKLLSRTANDNIGYIDWTGRTDTILTRLLRLFRLPVGKKNHIAKVNCDLLVDYISRWIIALMGGSNTDTVLRQLKSVFEAIKLYYHPSNTGRWTGNLLSFMSALSNRFADRIRRERYKRHYWMKQIPKSHHLSNENITEFVKILAPITYLALYNKQSPISASKTLHKLATLRPELIIPTIVERTHVALDTLTEPHQLKSCLSVLSHIIRPMVISHKYYPEGRLQLIEILVRVLPAIDSNDIPKCMYAFQFMNCCFHRIRLANCSGIVATRPNLSEEEKELCHLTAQLEEFALQYLDRCFHFIESVNHENDNGMQNRDSMVTTVVTTTIQDMISHSSPEIFRLCLEKIYKFVTQRLFVGKTAISCAGLMTRALLYGNVEMTCQKFIPVLCGNIKECFEDNPDVINEEKPDKTIQWNLSILGDMIKNCGTEIIKYKSGLIEVCSLCLKLTAPDNYKKASDFLHNLIRGLTGYYTTHLLQPKPNDEHLWIDDWGSLMTIYDLKMNWHIPNREELELAYEFIDTFLLAQVKLLEDFIADKKKLSKDELLRCLKIIANILKAAKVILPFTTDEEIQIEQGTEVPIRTWDIKTIQLNPAYKDAMTPTRSQIRKHIFDTTRAALKHILKTREDDATAISHCLYIYSEIFDFNDKQMNNFNQSKTVLQLGEAMIDDPLIGNHRKVQALLVQRISLQNSLRYLAIDRYKFNKSMDLAMQDLIKLSMSHYMQVRSNAQLAFFRLLVLSPEFLYRKYLPTIASAVAKGPEENHKAYKGALYLVLGLMNRYQRTIQYTQQWDVVTQIWPNIISSPHSDKVSIGNLYQKLAEKLQDSYNSIPIEEKFADNCDEVARLLCNSPLQNNTAAASAALESRSKENKQYYNSLVSQLLSLIDKGTLSWRNNEFACGMLMLMLRKDTKVHTQVVQLFFGNLVGNTLSTRQMATAACSSILANMKRKHKVDMRTLKDITGSDSAANEVGSGYRDDNRWLLYDSDNVPNTKEKYESTVFIEKTHWGYYSWPEKLKTYAPFDEQPTLDRSPNELKEGELAIYKKFMDPDFVEKLINFNSLENIKGKDSVDMKRVYMFKGLFRNFGDTFISTFRPHIERLSVETRESYQRCLAEIVTGLVVGSKHWGFDKLQLLWEWLIPVFQNILNHVSVEMLKDWDSMFALMMANRDPRKLHWLIEFLMKDVLSGTRSLFVESSHVYLLQSGLHQQEWRVPGVLSKLLEKLERNLDHQYKSLREKVGSNLASVFFNDITICNKEHLKLAPKRTQFIERVVPLIQDLMKNDVVAVITSKQNGQTSASPQTAMEISSPSMEQMNIPVEVLNQAKEGILSTLQSGSNIDEGKVMEKLQQYSGLSSAAIRNLMPQSLKSTSSSNEDDMEIEEEFQSLVANDDRSKQIRILKTLMKWVTCSQRSTIQPFIPEMLKILPMICKMSPVDTASSDEELNRDTQLSLSSIAQSYVPKLYLQNVVDAIKEISSSESWHTRYTVLTFMQVFVFNNLFTLQEDNSLPTQIYDTLITLIQDGRLEVREMASVTLGGLLQCGFLTVDEDIKLFITSKCKTRIKGKKHTIAPDELQRIIKRHSGVLAICSCLMSAPYDVPDWAPELVIRLGEHLHDPQPIEATVKKRISEFKRTHLDTWHMEKQKFTPDQLEILSDLLVSPSYYA